MEDHKTFTNVRKQWRPYIQGLLRDNEKAMWKALLLVYNNQTNDEKYKGISSEDNNVGFTKYDAPLLSRVARKWLRHEAISVQEQHEVYVRMPKYWRQVMAAIQEKDALKAEAAAEENRLVDEMAEAAEQREYYEQIGMWGA